MPDFTSSYSVPSTGAAAAGFIAALALFSATGETAAAGDDHSPQYSRGNAGAGSAIVVKPDAAQAPVSNGSANTAAIADSAAATAAGGSDSDFGTDQLQISAAGDAKGRLYRVRLTNANGETTSSTTALNLLEPPAFDSDLPATIEVDLAEAGTNGVRLAVVALGNPAPALQWQQSADRGATWTDIAGATTTALRLSRITPHATGTAYRVRAKNSVGEAFSTVGTLRVGNSATGAGVPAGGEGPRSRGTGAPQLERDLRPLTPVVAGAPAVLEVKAASPTALIFEWEVSNDGGRTWRPAAKPKRVAKPLDERTLANTPDDPRPVPEIPGPPRSRRR
ncbi:MAG: hypothetical protein LBR07_07915 [Puniceicoccales bacterium]|nr:hypothetical protein [Puniceicoccales bacterium]